MKRPQTIPILCYALIFAAWIVDLFTPQLFVAAILLNGPIALSGLALSSRLTVSLVVLAEIANVVSGYVNGVQANYHWDPIALGDRVLLAASFILVGYLTVRAHEYARDAGEATERARASGREKDLRRALEAVRATLNVELVLRAIVRHSLRLAGAAEAVLIIRQSQLALPDVYRFGRDAQDVWVERSALDPAITTLLQRATEEARIVTAREDDPVARIVLESHHASSLLIVRITLREGEAVLFLFATQFEPDASRLLQAFADGSSVALAQARLFDRLGAQNEEIASQKDALENRSRVIRDIVYALAHDLRTPLTAANVTMQQALEGAYGELPESYRDILKTSLASNDDVRRLVETLLLVARFESGESSSLREPVDCKIEAQRVVQELTPIARVRGVDLNVEADDGATVAGDPAEVRRAMTNLVANAIEATPVQGHVQLTVHRNGATIDIVVRDDGYGVDPAKRPYLFQRFGGGERSVGGGGGTGLGLYIVRLIAEKLGGRVAYEARDPRGSDFTLTLPHA